MNKTGLPDVKMLLLPLLLMAGKICSGNSASWGRPRLRFTIQAPLQLQMFTTGAVIAATAHNGLHVQFVCCPDDACLNVGTPEELRQAIRTLTLF